MGLCYLVLGFALSATVFAQFPIERQQSQFRVVLEWRVLDFRWPDPSIREQYLLNQSYIPENNLLSDVKPYGNRIFVTVPRMKPGVPATLAWIPEIGFGRTDPPLEPFPSWEMNRKGDCNALQFVQGIAIDNRGIMWVVDAGRTETLTNNPSMRCRPKLVLLDLNRDGQVVRRHTFSEYVVKTNASYLNKIVVDGGYAYITDNSGADPGIVVYSLLADRAWKVREPNSMRAARNAVNLVVNGTSISFPINIDGIALGSREDGTRVVYYCPLTSFHLYAMPVHILRNESLSSDQGFLRTLVADVGIKASQTDGMIMDNEGILYYGLLGEHAIAMWDSREPFSSGQRIISKDQTFIQWVDGMGFDENGYLYVVINRLQNFVAGYVNRNEVNYRILRAHTGTRSYVFAENAELSYDVEKLPHISGASKLSSVVLSGFLAAFLAVFVL
ncbi:protein yellow-like [Ctenocephalides felis]|uniref:protein yellow-like n=1 Tax=Ctenocephalides felis TaxID=7515 RepID=UPI000E6E2B4D|nr:protein yellow-like [Ctenocephalides felis]XP_026468979.1 protein yellow-like [Ctenocephalides felis]